MTQGERRIWLVNYLLKENHEYADIRIPDNPGEQWRLLRALMNIRPAVPISDEFIPIQDEFLKQEIKKKGITDISSLAPVSDDIYLWQGDITTLRCDAIVNAANSGMTGCYVPCHGCIDNAIHTYAGVQLRLECAEIMLKQGHDEETGSAKITGAYNLPSSFVIHTVGPIVRGSVPTEEDGKLLSSCYESCLESADGKGLCSIAFCCISTGEFHYPSGEAAKIAFDSVAKYKARTGSKIKVVFTVFKDNDRKIYSKLLGNC